MMTESTESLLPNDSDETRSLTDDARGVSSDDADEGWQPPTVRWGWWMMVSGLAVAGTLFIVNWLGWEHLPIAARLIVLVELFLVACFVLFLVLGERFSEWAGYGSLWSNDEEQRANSRDSISRSDRNWSRTAQLKQYLRRTYYEVKCQQSTVISREWRRTQPGAVSPRAERQGQNSAAKREAGVMRTMPESVPQVQSAPRRQPAAPAPIVQSPESSASAPAPVSTQSTSEIAAIEAPSSPAVPKTPNTCRLNSRIEIRRRY
jgi:hypothetical protein